jgi:hypothetical protein
VVFGLDVLRNSKHWTGSSGNQKVNIMKENPITLIKKRMQLPFFRKRYPQNISTWFEVKSEPIRSSCLKAGMILQSYEQIEE